MPTLAVIATLPRSTDRPMLRTARTARPEFPRTACCFFVEFAAVRTVNSTKNVERGSGGGGLGQHPGEEGGGLVGGFGGADLVGPEEVGHDAQHPLHERARPHADAR